jgi:uncharacterized protein
MNYQPGWDPSRQPPPPPAYVPTADERSMAMLAHLAAFAGFFVPLLGHIGGPLIVLLVRGDSSPFVSYHAREALNFNITVTLLAFVFGALCFVLIGFPLLGLLMIGWFVFTILAALRARDGYGYRYPFTLRFIPDR